MKKFILLFACAVFCASAYAQEPATYAYCELVGTGNLTGTKVTVEIDFGQKSTLTSDDRLRGEDGKPLKFNSMVDAMNWMASDGWEVDQTYLVGSGPYVYHWLLRKDISQFSPEQREAITAQFKTKKDFK